MSSISSRSLSMSSLIFLPFFAISGLAAPPSPPPSFGLVGRVSFFFCSAIVAPPWAPNRVACRSSPRHAFILTEAPSPARSDNRAGRGSAPEVLAQAQGLVLVRRGQPHSVHPLGPAAEPLEPDLEGGLAVVDHERHLPRPHLHNNLRAENAPIAESEAGIEEPRVMRANLARAGVVDHHLGCELRGHADPLFGHQDVEPIGFQDVAVAHRRLDRLPELAGVVVTDACQIY